VNFLGCLVIQTAIVGVAMFVPWFPVTRLAERRGWTERTWFWVYLPFLVPLVVLATLINGEICELW
jgi:hypothetical protein